MSRPTREQVASATERKRAQLRASAWRVFNDKGEPGDGLRVLEALVIASKVNEPTPKGNGIDGLAELLRRDGRRDMWLEFSAAIKRGEQDAEEHSWDTLASSEGGA